MTAEARLLVDTDLLVDFLRGHPKAVAFLQRHASRIALPAVVVAELYAGVKGDEELGALDDLMSLLRIVPVTSSIARAAGLYRCKYGASHGVSLADAIIAATADSERADLKTLNVRHYPMFKGLRPAYTK